MQNEKQSTDYTGLYDVRPYQTEDKPFIMASFLRGLYYGEFFWNNIPKDIFMNNYKHLIENMLTSPNVSVQVACMKEQPDTIIGYSILSTDYQTIRSEEHTSELQSH